MKYLITLLLASVLLTSCAPSPTPTDESEIDVETESIQNMGVYTNGEFSFEYPADYEVVESGEDFYVNGPNESSMFITKRDVPFGGGDGEASEGDVVVQYSKTVGPYLLLTYFKIGDDSADSAFTAIADSFVVVDDPLNLFNDEPAVEVENGTEADPLNLF